MNMTEEIKNKDWYVLRVMGGKEKKTVSFIEKEIDRLNMHEHVSKILVPTEKVYQIRNGKKVSKERNFFPGYVLVEANLSGEVPHILKNITNVLGFLGATKGGVPVPMRQNEINKILGRVDEMALTDEHVSIPFIVGESVKVIDGPFNSFHRREQVNLLDSCEWIDQVEWSLRTDGYCEQLSHRRLSLQNIANFIPDILEPAVVA